MHGGSEAGNIPGIRVLPWVEMEYSWGVELRSQGKERGMVVPACIPTTLGGGGRKMASVSLG
jgi:hypothetical protein